jgi:hypothetical protein
MTAMKTIAIWHFKLMLLALRLYHEATAAMRQRTRQFAVTDSPWMQRR